MAKRRKKPTGAKQIAKVGAGKAKEAVQFVYKHRKKIMEAIEMVAAVVATASTILGKPTPRRRRR